QLDGGDPEGREVLDRLIRCESRIGAAEIRGYPLEPLREPLHVRLVDDGLGERRTRRPVVLPVEVAVDHHALRKCVGVVLVVALLVEEAQLHARRVLREQREIHPLAVPRRSKGEGLAWPDLPHRSSAPASGSSVILPSWMRPECEPTTISVPATGTCDSCSEK